MHLVKLHLDKREELDKECQGQQEERHMEEVLEDLVMIWVQDQVLRTDKDVESTLTGVAYLHLNLHDIITAKNIIKILKREDMIKTQGDTLEDTLITLNISTDMVPVMIPLEETEEQWKQTLCEQNDLAEEVLPFLLD